MNNRIHRLKSWPVFFQAIVNGARTHELRRNDRNYKIGDKLVLCEFDLTKSEFTGASCELEITSITSAEEPCAVSEEALNRNFCILSIRRL